MSVYTIDIKFNTRVERSKRVLEVAESFGIGLDEKEFVVFNEFPVEVESGDVVYITGQSGSGKSVVLRELQRQMRAEGKKVVNIDQIEFQDCPLIDQIGKDTNDAIRLMGAAGINDAYLYVRKPSELSDGQRYRFRLAKCIESGADVWAADEFLAVLDRVAAKIVAYAVQKVSRRAGATLLVATTHTDMVPDLCPSLVIEKRYREKVRVETFENAAEQGAKRVLTRDDLNQLMIGTI